MIDWSVCSEPNIRLQRLYRKGYHLGVFVSVGKAEHAASFQTTPRALHQDLRPSSRRALRGAANIRLYFRPALRCSCEPGRTTPSDSFLCPKAVCLVHIRCRSELSGPCTYRVSMCVPAAWPVICWNEGVGRLWSWLHRRRSLRWVAQSDVAIFFELSRTCKTTLSTNAFRFTMECGQAALQLSPSRKIAQRGISSRTMMWALRRSAPKPITRGTGYGMALVERVVRRHGGRVWAEGELRHGTCPYYMLA